MWKFYYFDTWYGHSFVVYSGIFVSSEILRHCNMIIGVAINAIYFGYITLEYLSECKCIEVPKVRFVFHNNS